MRKVLKQAVILVVLALLLIMSACSHEKRVASVSTKNPVETANEIKNNNTEESPEQNSKPAHTSDESTPTYYALELLANHPSVIGQINPTSAGCIVSGFDYTGDVAIPVMEIYDENADSKRETCASSHSGIIVLFDYHDVMYSLEVVFLESGNQIYLHCGSNEVDITQMIESEQIPSRMTITDSNLFLGCDRELLCFDLYGHYQSTAAVPSAITDMFSMPDGSVMILCKTAQESSIFQIEATDLTTLIEVPLPDAANECNFAAGYHSPYDFILFDDRYIYGWTIGDDELCLITDCLMLGLQASQISDIAFINENQILLATWVSGELTDQLYLLTPSEPPEQDGTMTMAGISMPKGIAQAISDYNLQHQELPITYVDYRELYGDRAEEQLEIDIATGNAPDLICLNGVSYHTLANNDLLVNLYTRMEGDEGYTQSDFFENQLEALEYRPGVLFRLPQSVSICTVFGLKSIIGEKYAWTLEELYETYAQSEIDMLFFSQTPEQVLKELLFQSFARFADYSTGEVRFESEDFISLLNFAKSCNSDSSVHDADELTCLKKQEILLMPALLSRFDQYADIYEKLDGDVISIGYPDAGGSTLYLNNPVAIMSSSPYVEEAWQFIKLFISSDRYSTRGGWLLRRGDLSRAFSAELASDKNTNESAAVYAELQAIDHCADYDSVLSTIVMDEAEAFFAGENSAEKTAELIQKRAELYFAEIGARK